jgi:phosphatidylinositol alpha-mannosyltransferase
MASCPTKLAERPIVKVAVVCPYAFDAHGGVQDQVARIVGWLRADGHEAWAVAPGSNGPEGTRHVGGFVSVRANRSKAPVALNPMVLKRVATAVADADVVHIHEPFMPMVSLGALLADTPPKVGTFHADPGRITRGFYRGGSWLLRRWGRRLAAVTAVSQVAAQALGSIVEPRIVPNGIDLASYSSDVDRLQGRVLFIGRDDRRKGLDLLLEAWPQVRRQAPEATLHIIGAEGSVAAAGVSYLGRVPEESKHDELGAAEVLVAPNRGGESFGIVVLEGLAAGCAVVASDLAAFRAVAGDAAAYFPVGDSAALAVQVGRVLESAAVRAEMTATGFDRIQPFGDRAVLAGYLTAYEAARFGV